MTAIWRKLPRRINMVLAIAWALMIPLSVATGWIYSVAFVSIASIYANAVSHWAARQADMPNPEDVDA